MAPAHCHQSSEYGSFRGDSSLAPTGLPRTVGLQAGATPQSRSGSRASRRGENTRGFKPLGLGQSSAETRTAVTLTLWFFTVIFTVQH